MSDESTFTLHGVPVAVGDTIVIDRISNFVQRRLRGFQEENKATRYTAIITKILPTIIKVRCDELDQEFSIYANGLVRGANREKQAYPSGDYADYAAHLPLLERSFLERKRQLKSLASQGRFKELNIEMKSIFDTLDAYTKEDI